MKNSRKWFRLSVSVITPYCNHQAATSKWLCTSLTSRPDTGSKHLQEHSISPNKIRQRVFKNKNKEQKNWINLTHCTSQFFIFISSSLIWLQWFNFLLLPNHAITQKLYLFTKVLILYKIIIQGQTVHTSYIVIGNLLWTCDAWCIFIFTDLTSFIILFVAVCWPTLSGAMSSWAKGF